MQMAVKTKAVEHTSSNPLPFGSKPESASMEPETAPSIPSKLAIIIQQGEFNAELTKLVEELLRKATNLRAWGFRHNRHDFYVLSSDTFTLAYDLKTHKWSRWDSFGKPYFRAHLGVQLGGAVYGADAAGNSIWQLVEGYDDDGLTVVREVTGGLAMTSLQNTPLSTMAVKVNAGWSRTYGIEPFLEIRWSDDLGFTWSDYYQVGMGMTGEYKTDLRLRSLGQMQRPGREFEFRFSHPARFRLDYAVVNE